MTTKHLDEVEERDIHLNYYILAENIYYEELDTIVVSYGIEVEKVEGDNLERTVVRNITCNKNKMRDIKDLLVQNKVLPIQLEEVVIDII